VSNRLPALPVLVAALLLATAAAGGCQKSQDAITAAAIATASGGKVKVDKDGDKMTIKTDEGELAVQHGDALPLPRDFPEDVYLPGKYQISSVMDMAGAQVVSMQAPGKVATLFSAARDSMDKEGWKQTMAMQNSADSAMLAYEKAQRVAVLSFNGDNESDDVTMSVQLRNNQSQ